MATTARTRNRNHSDAPQALRRVSRACDRCRSRKYKCDGNQPCTTCREAQHACKYGSNFRKRGLAEGYVRGLERLLGLAVSLDPSFESTVTSVIHSYGDGDGDGQLGQPFSGRAAADKAGIMLDAWKKSKIPDNMARLIPALEAIDSQGKWSQNSRLINGINRSLSQGPSTTEACGRAIGPSPLDVSTRDAISVEVHPPQLQTVECDTLPHPEQALVQDVPQDAQSSVHGMVLVGPSELDIPSQHLLADASFQSPAREIERPTDHNSFLIQSSLSQPLPPASNALIDSYFRLSHCWFPIVERYNVQRLLYQYRERCRAVLVAPQLTTGTGEIAVLWAIIAYEASFLQCEDDTDKRSCRSSSGCMCSRRPYGVARSLIPDEDSLYEVGHVQALLILALYNTRRAQWRQAWLLSGQATRISLDNGFDGTTTGNGPPSRKLHVFLGCFILETLISARLGRMPLLRGDSLSHISLPEEDGIDEWEPWRASSVNQPSGPCLILSTFNKTLKTMKILNDFLCNSAAEVVDDYKIQLSTVMQSRAGDSSIQSQDSSMPHRALLHLTHAAVSRLISPQPSVNSHSAQASTPDNAQISSYLADCCKAFGPERLPPLAEFLGHVLLECLDTQPCPPEDLQTRQSIRTFTLTGNGKAFRKLQERSNLAPQHESQETLPHKVHESDSTAFPLANKTQISEGQTKPRNYMTDGIRDAPGIISPPLTMDLGQSIVDHPIDGHGDGVFDSLAFLDTTRWSEGWGDQLPELGFADTAAFKDFCNDNERIMED